jgi:tRNA(Ile2) C34 agmatinyltransferase TiaS
MIQQTVQLEPPPGAGARQEFVFHNYQKYGLLILLAGLLYLRLVLRKRRNERTCPRCGHRNQSQLSNCAKCSSPLMDLGRGLRRSWTPTAGRREK